MRDHAGGGNRNNDKNAVMEPNQIGKHHEHPLLSVVVRKKKKNRAGAKALTRFSDYLVLALPQLLT